jgi:peroxiredoxin
MPRYELVNDEVQVVVHHLFGLAQREVVLFFFLLHYTPLCKAFSRDCERDERPLLVVYGKLEF